MSTGWATHSHSLTPPPWLPAAVSHSRRRLRPKIDKEVDDVKDRGRKLRQRGERHCCSQGNTNSWNHKNVSHQSDVCFANWCLSSWSHSHLRYEVFVKWYLCSMNLTPKAILGWLFRLKFKAVLPSKVFQHQRRFFFPTDCFKPYIKVKISQERSFGQSSLPEPPASPEAAGHMTRPRDWNAGQIPGWRRIYIALFGRKFNSKILILTTATPIVSCFQTKSLCQGEMAGFYTRDNLHLTQMSIERCHYKTTTNWVQGSMRCIHTA